MPFINQTVMEQKIDFVTLAIKSDTTFSELCSRFNISRRTGYKWLKRYKESGRDGLLELSRRPFNSPNQTSSETQELIIQLRQDNPEWGAKKLERLLENGLKEGIFNIKNVPAQSTINKILKKNNLISNRKSSASNKWKMFEYEAPNELWQMDFKGFFPLLNRKRCYPLTITDDHSRYNITLSACENETYNTVHTQLIKVFQKYGLPEMILADNGNPWGTSSKGRIDGQRYYTSLEKWLMQLNIKVVHGRPYHPQTQGKEERFHRTLKTELLNYESFRDKVECQRRFDQWRHKYNHQRPHESLGQDTPASRYIASSRSYPAKLKAPEYDLTDQVRRVNEKGYISFKGQRYYVGEAFRGDNIAIRPTTEENIMNVIYCNTSIKKITL